MLELAKANGKSLTTIPLPSALIQSGVRLVSTALARQLFEDAVVDISETVQRTDGWEPKDTVDCIHKEFGRDGRFEPTTKTAPPVWCSTRSRYAS